jgi:hypothetical protein
MRRSDPQRDLDEFQSTVDLLRTNRPEASALELDAVKRRVLARAAHPSRPSRPGAVMRTRAAIVATLALGFAMSTAGAGLAVSGFTGNDQASVAQYPAPPAPQPQVTPPTPQTEVLGEEQTPSAPGAEEEEAPAALPEQEVAPETPPGAAPEVQPERQVSTGLQGEELPFTGFAAIPVLLIGLALISVGLVTHRRSRIG